ncbi:hypothetical protein ABZ638_19810 [Streptomyces sp. NPDC007107]|uniref:hypothetical protein n=1 Tax=Streptomyces sp. NPDC007107 TaxID=3156915 RepID=UPI0033F25738
MAVAGHVKENYWEGCDAERIAFVDRLRHLLRSSPYSVQGARAHFLGIPLSSLSCYWSGRRVPDQARLKKMHQALCGVTEPQTATVALSELEQLRRSAARRSRDVNAAVHVSSSASESRTDDKIPVPAVPCGNRPALPAEDRRNAPNSAAAQTIGALVAAEAAGERRTLLGIAWSASKAMAPSEISATVAELHDMGRADLAEAVLLGGRERVQAEAMHLALALMGRELTTYAELVMRAALPSSDAGTGHRAYQ